MNEPRSEQLLVPYVEIFCSCEDEDCGECAGEPCAYYAGEAGGERFPLRRTADGTWSMDQLADAMRRAGWGGTPERALCPDCAEGLRRRTAAGGNNGR